MRRLACALFLVLASLGSAAAQSLPAGVWTPVRTGTAADEVAALWTDTGRFVFTLSCQVSAPGLVFTAQSLSFAYRQPSPAAMFLRVGNSDYVLPWRADVWAAGAGTERITLAMPETIRTQPWQGQQALLAALLAGERLQLMVSRAPDRSGASVVYQTLPQPGAPALAALQQTCKEPPPAPPRRSPAEDRLRSVVTAEIAGLCRGAGATLGQHVFQEMLTRPGTPPDIIVDFSFVACNGPPGPGAGRCGPDGCEHRRYLPGQAGYTLGFVYRE